MIFFMDTCVLELGGAEGATSAGTSRAGAAGAPEGLYIEHRVRE